VFASFISDVRFALNPKSDLYPVTHAQSPLTDARRSFLVLFVSPRAERSRGNFRRMLSFSLKKKKKKKKEKKKKKNLAEMANDNIV